MVLEGRALKGLKVYRKEGDGMKERGEGSRVLNDYIYSFKRSLLQG